MSEGGNATRERSVMDIISNLKRASRAIVVIAVASAMLSLTGCAATMSTEERQTVRADMMDFVDSDIEALASNLDSYAEVGAEQHTSCGDDGYTSTSIRATIRYEQGTDVLDVVARTFLELDLAPSQENSFLLGDDIIAVAYRSGGVLYSVYRSGDHQITMRAELDCVPSE